MGGNTIRKITRALGALLLSSSTAALAAPAGRDDAAIFGARQDVSQISLSPSGARIAFIAPGPGQSTMLFVSDVAGGSDPVLVLTGDGKPNRLSACRWSSETRLVCTIHIVTPQAGEVIEGTRLVGVDSDGKNLKMLSRQGRADDAYVALSGGDVIDWLPGEDGAVLMQRQYVPSEAAGTHMVDSREGFGVDRVDTASLAARVVEGARKDAWDYISDGRGKVRILGTRQIDSDSGYQQGGISYFYRVKDSNGWKPIGVSGFTPAAVDPDLDVAYGFQDKDGRQALFSLALDGSKTENLVYARPDVDVDQLIRIGRRQRVVGVSYATDRRESLFFDKGLLALGASLSKALPGLPLIEFVDSSVDEGKLLLFAGSDTDPGRYYLFDKGTHRMNELMLARPDLEGRQLAVQKPVTYKAADGTSVPAYLTLPPGSSGRNLPTIVMPHGGPSSRDEWGFDWLSQYFAARGYAVLQPNYRGSSGYGDAFFAQNGFQSWRTAMGDVADAGRWLVAQGIADPSKLAIFGWSYGGYAALQANVIDPKLFKAVVAVAPVTDLASLIEERRGWSDFLVQQRFVGSGPHIREGSPAQNADKITAPVLLFHGELDRNVTVHESRLMDEKLKSAGRQSELIVYPGLDHQLEDSAARADMLRRSDAFLRAALHIQ